MSTSRWIIDDLARATSNFPEMFCIDHWRYRYVRHNMDLRDDRATYMPTQSVEVVALLCNLTDAGIDLLKMENLYLFDGAFGFSFGQDE